MLDFELQFKDWYLGPIKFFEVGKKGFIFIDTFCLFLKSVRICTAFNILNILAVKKADKVRSIKYA